MPSDANFSPEFHEVKPETVPAHSFCQIFRPMRDASVRDNSIAWAVPATAMSRKTAKTARWRRHLDGRTFSTSVLTSAACRWSEAANAKLFMKKSIIYLALLALTSTGFAQGTTDLKTEKDKVSYSIGLDIGSTFKKQDMDINLDVLMAGLKDAVDGKKPAMTDDQVKETMAAYSKTMMEKQTAKAKEESGKNKAVGDKFLAENKTKEGVKVLPVKVPAEPGEAAGGKENTVDLQYKVLKEGSGESPKETDTVVVQYKGTLIDGKEFDSSYKRNEPATFPVNRVIKGWTEGLQLMKPGAKYQFFIPSELAYGERGAGQDIGPNETLIFEVELVSVKAPDAATPAAGMPPTGKPAPGASPAVASTPSASAKPAASPKPTAK